MSEKELETRLDELDRAKDYLNSTYYWKRRNEIITGVHSDYYLDTDRNKSIETHPTTLTSSNEKDTDWFNDVRV